MDERFQIFNAIELDLAREICLIEASAGTGKTYAITMLVLRAVSELSLPIERILVVTFTKAATEELREKIREKLVAARDVLGGEKLSEDPTLQAWKDRLADPVKARYNLQYALYDIDKLQVFTIHSFCQKMLREQALESGQLFDAALVASEAVRIEIASDFWRRHILNLPAVIGSELTDRYADPVHLHDSVSESVAGFGSIEPDFDLQEEFFTESARHYADLCQSWNRVKEQLCQNFEKARRDGCLKKDFAAELDTLWHLLESFFAEEGSKKPKKFNCLTTHGLLDVLNGHKLRGSHKQHYISTWPLLDSEIETWEEGIELIILGIRIALAKYIRTEFPMRMNQQGYLSFDELIVRMASLLTEDTSGLLQTSIAGRYSMALIDEFQDTDQAQWQIFSRLFGGNKHSLYLIGDPKQAIYRFRGADIHSYFQAKTAAQRLLTLNTCYRSHPHLVAEVNRIFGGRPRPFYFDEERIAYSEVGAAKTVEDCSLHQDGQPLGAFVYRVFPETNVAEQWTSDSTESVLKADLLREIIHLTQNIRPVQFQSSKKTGQGDNKLQLSDIAILVRTNDQGERIARYLVNHGIPAVLASKISVYSTVEASELLCLLEVIVYPSNMQAIKNIMSLQWFGLTGNELHEMVNDQQSMDHLVNMFQKYHQLWQTQGFLSMIIRFFENEKIYLHIAESSRAERIIANLHHLVELLQESATEKNFGSLELVSWFRQKIKNPETDDPSELRLESDKKAVQIRTIHNAKGLEFPVVFCPYLWKADSRTGREADQITVHDAENFQIVDLGSELFSVRREQAAHEEFAEQLRLLYVALTRAEARCYVYWFDKTQKTGRSQSLDSALGYLLFPDANPTVAEQIAILSAKEQYDGVEYCPVNCTPPSFQPVEATGEVHIHLATPTYLERDMATNWQLTSFSALAELTEECDLLDSSIVPVAARPESILPAANLPKGVAFGNLVHDLLENLSFTDLASSGCTREQIAQSVNRYRLDIDYPVLSNMLQAVVSSSLPGLVPQETDRSWCLADLDADALVKEMPFHLRIQPGNTHAVNSILAADPTVRPLAYRELEGFLTGYIDLFFAYEGRYYIVDYKTNYLGETADRYGTKQLQEAMMIHNYGLQYWLYTLVVHRFLGNFLENYSYERHFGGVYYLFVRGMGAGPGDGIFATRPDEAMVERLARIFG